MSNWSVTSEAAIIAPPMPSKPRKQQTPKKPPRYRRIFLREWREFRGMTLEQLAFKSGYNEGYLSDLENGKRRYNQELLEALAPALRTSPARLIDRPPPAGADDPDAAWEAMTDTDRARALAIFQAAVGAARN